MSTPETGRPAPVTFQVSLGNFEGPFDLLLSLIGRHKLDVTEVALSVVTDEFLAYVQARDPHGDLEETSSFLVVAATLLDLKAAKLLPNGQAEDLEDFEALEARDLLFARLLQYRAFKQVATWLADRFALEALVIPRSGRLEEQFRGLLPPVTIPGGADRLARVAERVLSVDRTPSMPLLQLHATTVSVVDQARLIAERLQRHPTTTFRTLTADADRATTVARFLALLELYRRGAVGFEQLQPLGELTIRWTGDRSTEVTVTDDYEGVLPAADPDALSPGEE